jgi:integrase
MLARIQPQFDQELARRFMTIVTDAVRSPHTKVAYSHALKHFINWYVKAGMPILSKATIQRYFNELREAGTGPSVINLRRSAIRKLMIEAAENNALDPHLLASILRVKAEEQTGRRLGNWLTYEQAIKRVNSPDITTLKGVRDRAILAVFIGCGLRRNEVAGLTFEHIQMRDGRWVIVDIVGKRNKLRSVAIPTWAKVAIDAWADRAGISSGRLFRAISRGGNLQGETMTPQALYKLVNEYSRKVLGFTIAPHDLRRSCAKIAKEHGAPMDQIQFMLGHKSIQTTERYLGTQQNLVYAPCDTFTIEISQELSLGDSQITSNARNR